jgi:hypothetical protein
MGYRYGISIWDMSHRNGKVIIDMGDDSIDMVILDIDMGYVVTLPGQPSRRQRWQLPQPQPPPLPPPPPPLPP